MYSEPSETFKMELSIKIVDSIQRLTIFAKHFIVGVLQGYQYVFDKAKQNLGALSLIPQKIRTAIFANFFHFHIINHKFSTRVFDFRLIHPCS